MDKRIHIALLILLCAVIGAGTAWLVYIQWYVVDVQEVDIRFQVMSGQHIGFDTNTSLLSFGKVPRGGGAERKATLETYIPTRAHIQVQGTPWVHATPATLDLEPGVAQQVHITLDVPADAALGNYTGKARITYTRR